MDGVGCRGLSRDFLFEERLIMSQGVATSASIESVLVQNIPGAVSAHRASQADDRSGTDWWVKMPSGHLLSVDCKVRQEDWLAKKGVDDLALEYWSVKEQNIVGWTLRTDKRTDYVLWLWKDTGRWCLIPFAMLCRVFRDNKPRWCEEYRTAEQTTGGRYTSACVFVPRREVWAAIYRTFGGQRHVA